MGRQTDENGPPWILFGDKEHARDQGKIASTDHEAWDTRAQILEGTLSPPPKLATKHALDTYLPAPQSPTNVLQTGKKEAAIPITSIR
jgi:hypothetical protein